MKDAENNMHALWLREKCLIIMRHALIAYEQHGDQVFMDYAKWFGNLSHEIKSDLDKQK